MRVVVTRPQAQATATAARLHQRGHEAIILPLTEIVGLNPADRDLSGVHCVAVTSANALLYTNSTLLKRISHLPLFAVGDRTAEAARKAGFSKVTSASGDVDALAPIVAQRTSVGDRVLYLCGRVRRPQFEAALTAAGRPVVAVETYETRALAPGMDAVAALRNAGSVMVYAQSAARRLSEIGVSGSSATFVCMSRRVADALDAPPANVRVASHPEEASMLDEIDRLP